jgi:anaerobic dimethyl sulfoxide reductase subunit A
VVRWPDAILEGRDGGYPSDLKAAYSVGGNLLNQGADLTKSLAAFRHLDFTVCHDLFLTPTARHCDVVLPAAHALEKEDIGIPWLGNFLAYKRPVLPVRGQARSDFDILCDLGERVGVDFAEGRSAAQWLQSFLDQSEVPDHEAFRSTGLYLAPDQERVGLEAFAEDPARHPLGTPSGRVELASERYERETGFPAIPAWQAPPEDPRHPLRLITPKAASHTHSQGRQCPPVEPVLEVHARDAAARDLGDGRLARLSSSQGEAWVRIRLSPDLAPGVVSLLEGFWADLDTPGRGGSANLFTGTEGTAPSRSCILSAVPVELRRD